MHMQKQKIIIMIIKEIGTVYALLLNKLIEATVI